MKSKALLLLLGLVLVMTVPVRCQEEEGGEEAEEGAEAAAPKAKPVNKGGAAYTADIPLEALSKLPVEPLSMDAAALKEDDAQFELFLNGKEPRDQNVLALTTALNKATTLMRKMQRDVEAEKVWTKNVYDIIQNYQYKYLKNNRRRETAREETHKNGAIGRSPQIVNAAGRRRARAQYSRESAQRTRATRRR